jgi:hypothetical protein
MKRRNSINGQFADPSHRNVAVTGLPRAVAVRPHGTRSGAKASLMEIYFTKHDFDTADERLAMCDSYQCTGQLAREMAYEDEPHKQIALFLDWGNHCDAPFPWRSELAAILREALKQVRLVDVLADPERTWFEGLGAAIPIYRGCEKDRERGLHWTTDRAVAMEFAKGKRCTNRNPTLVSAYIPKEHVFAVFLNRNEHEIVVDPRRLRRVKIEPGSET